MSSSPPSKKTSGGGFNKLFKAKPPKEKKDEDSATPSGAAANGGKKVQRNNPLRSSFRALFGKSASQEKKTVSKGGENNNESGPSANESKSADNEAKTGDMIEATGHTRNETDSQDKQQARTDSTTKKVHGKKLTPAGKEELKKRWFVEGQTKDPVVTQRSKSTSYDNSNANKTASEKLYKGVPLAERAGYKLKPVSLKEMSDCTSKDSANSKSELQQVIMKVKKVNDSQGESGKVNSENEKSKTSADTNVKDDVENKTTATENLATNTEHENAKSAGTSTSEGNPKASSKEVTILGDEDTGELKLGGISQHDRDVRSELPVFVKQDDDINVISGEIKLDSKPTDGDKFEFMKTIADTYVPQDPSPEARTTASAVNEHIDNKNVDAFMNLLDSDVKNAYEKQTDESKAKEEKTWRTGDGDDEDMTKLKNMERSLEDNSNRECSIPEVPDSPPNEKAKTKNEAQTKADKISEEDKREETDEEEGSDENDDESLRISGSTHELQCQQHETKEVHTESETEDM